MNRLGIREIVFFVVLMAIPLFIGLKVLKPSKLEMAQLKEETNIWEDKISLMAAKKTPAFASVQKSVDVLNSAEESVLQRLPYASENNQTLEKLSQLTHLHNLRTINYKPFPKEEIVPNEGSLRPDQIRLVRQRVAFNLEGGFKDFYRMLQAVEQLPQIIHVENIMCDPAKGQDVEDKIRVTLDLTLYFQLDAPKEKADG